MGYRQATTSFAEAQIFEDSTTAQEAALKIHNLGRIVVAVAGDVTQSNEFIQTLKAEIDSGNLASRELLEHIVQPFVALEDLSLQFIATIPADPSPILLSFNMGNERRTTQHSGDGVVQAGSPTEVQTEMFRLILHLLDERLPMTPPDTFLVAALAWLQSLGMREHLLQRGIGGAFYGVYAHADLIGWMPDIVFGIHHQMRGSTIPVLVIVRDNVLLVRSGIDEASRAMYSSLSGISVREWYARHHSFDEAVLRSKIRFVVLIDSVEWKIAVFELDVNGQSKYMRFEGPTQRLDGRIQMAVDFDPNIMATLRMPLPTPQSPTGIPILFTWSPPNDAPRIVRFVLDTNR
jgi:hypothetical protein